jgi:hypothetical protein
VPSDLTLGLAIGPITAEPAPRSVMEAITEITVHAGAESSNRSGFDIKLAAGKSSELIADLLPGGYFDPPSRVIISATLRGATTVLIDGVITTQEVVPSDEAGKSVLSLKGEDLTRMLDLIDLSGLPYPCLPAEARVALLLLPFTAIYQTVPLVIPSVLLDIPNPIFEIPIHLGTSLAYIKRLADRVGYTFFVQPGPEVGMSIGYWGPMLRIPIPFLGSPPDLAIDWDGSSNVESLQFSFDGFKKTLFVVLIQPDGVPIPIPIPVPDVTPLSPPMGEKNPIPLKVSPLTGLAKYNPLQAAAIALARASEGAMVISGGGSLDVIRYGAIIGPRTMVNVRGAGITFDGQYFVDSVTHTIKPGSYKQSFTLTRNRLQASGAGLQAGQRLPTFAAAPTGPAPLPNPGTGPSPGQIVPTLPASP